MATDSSAHIISLRKPKPALTPAERAKACRLRKKRQKTGPTQDPPRPAPRSPGCGVPP